MNREFLINIAFLVFINLLIKPFFIFGIDLQVQNQVGSDYGLYFALLNVTYLFQILGDLGLQNFNNRQVSRHRQLLPKYFPDLFGLKLSLSGVYVMAALLFAWLIAGYDAQALPLLLVLLLNQVLVQTILFLRSNISGLGYYRLDSFLSSLDKLLMLFTCGFLLYADAVSVTIMHFALAQTLALSLTALAIGWILRARVPLRFFPDWLSRSRRIFPLLFFLLKKSFPYALVVLLMTAYTRLDGVLLERWLPAGREHAEVYAGAYRLLDAGNMFGYLFATLLLPMFARMLRQGDDVRPLVSTSFKLIWAGSITLASVVYFGREDLIRLMMPERATAYRWETLGILIWTFVPVCTTYIFSTLLTADERLMQMNRFFVAGIGLDVLLNWWLIPEKQAIGSAWAALITQTFVAASMVVLCVRNYGFRPSLRGLLQVSGFVILLLASAYWIFTQWAAWWGYRVLLALVSAAFWAFATGMLGRNPASWLRDSGK